MSHNVLTMVVISMPPALWQQKACYHLALVRCGHHVLIAEAKSHHSDQESKEELKLPQPVLVKTKKGEGVIDSDQNSAPEGDHPVAEQVESNSSAYHFLHITLDDCYLCAETERDPGHCGDHHSSY